MDSTQHNAQDLGTTENDLHWALSMMEESTMLLIMANKQDLPNAMTPDEVAAALHLDGSGPNGPIGRPYQVMSSSATSGAGLFEALDRIDEHMS